jgi:hypothetical protein
MEKLALQKKLTKETKRFQFVGQAWSIVECTSEGKISSPSNFSISCSNNNSSRRLKGQTDIDLNRNHKPPFFTKLFSFLFTALTESKLM